jgi:hypothetical protein
MRVGFFGDRGGVSTPRLALMASGLAIASLIGVRVLEAPLASRTQAPFAAEAQTDLERLARTIPAAKGRVGGSALAAAAGQIDFTATANSAGKRSYQAACHGGRTVSMVAPAGGPPMVLSTCAAGKNWRD